MEHQVRNITALGLLVLVAGALFVWGFFFLIGDPILVGGDEVVVTMDDGAGLNRGSGVLLNGVQVGTVRRVDLRPPDRVTLRIKVDDDIPLPADTRAVARADVFGATTLELVPGRALVKLEGGDTIQGLTPQGLPALATELGGQARTILAAADSLLSPKAVNDLKTTASVLPEVAQQLRGAFAELSLAAASLKRTAIEMETARTGAAAGETLAEVQASARAATETLNTMELSLTSLASVMDKIDRGQGTLGRLVNDTTLYGEMSATLREVRFLASDVRENPKKYVSIEIF
ncbi:MAG: MCE family protein [Gemmatimonadetes bacterium]|nr:MCE family protein [Gemmatimonadota bacterium]NIQ54738.1 MCE family protein [Gemmatimonadota bacterium]NIU74950.1 MCE family protein [Gammaproteobacteria bacterium]NIX44823.1 MCE family protein [Gemmatimonadota bacterium]NIY09061.1 MCE family protein [Gemmatimonadota bacterium]